MLNPINVLKYWFYFIKELALVFKCYRVVKKIEPELYNQGLRVDWIGRVYAVINLEGDELNQPELLQQSIVLQSLSPISEILVKYGLSDVLYPDVRKIEGSGSYLVILYPETDYVDFGAVITATLATGGYATAVWAIVKFVPFDKLVALWPSL
jgi:hypothetical protein